MVVFDLDRIHDRATNLYPHTYPFKNFPHAYPDGIDYVLVNGTVVIDQGEHTGILPGKVLKHGHPN
jgi:N-acyl-D-amino-acid deacylase